MWQEKQPRRAARPDFPLGVALGTGAPRAGGGSVQSTSVTNDAPPLNEPIIDPAGRIAGDLPCVVCGYNLHTLAEASRCPECGAPVERSTAYHLRPSPEWLKRLEEGVNLLTTGIPVMGIGAGLLGLGGFLLGKFSGVAAAVPLLVLAVLLVCAIGVIKMTLADPIQLVDWREGLSWRWVTRVCLLLTPVGLITTLVLALSWYARLALVVAGLPALLLAPAFFFHMAALMTRVLRPDLARTARRLALALALAEVAVIVVYRIAWYVPGGVLRPGPIVLAVWGTVLGVILVLGYIFLIRAGRALTAAQHRAEHWLSGASRGAAEDAPGPQIGQRVD